MVFCGSEFAIISAVSRIADEPEPLSLMPGPSMTLSRCAPAMTTLSVFLPGSSAMTLWSTRVSAGSTSTNAVEPAAARAPPWAKPAPTTGTAGSPTPPGGPRGGPAAGHPRDRGGTRRRQGLALGEAGADHGDGVLHHRAVGEAGRVADEQLRPVRRVALVEDDHRLRAGLLGEERLVAEGAGAALDERDVGVAGEVDGGEGRGLADAGGGAGRGT